MEGSAVPSVYELSDCAMPHLSNYVDPGGTRAFRTYDLQGDPSRLDPLDYLAPALLYAPVRGSLVVALHRQEGPYRALRIALERVVADTASVTARFEDQDLEAGSGPWSLVRAALAASDSTPHIKASKVTKILHRKRPSLVPIFDSRVAGYYGVPVQTPWLMWPLLQADLLAHSEWLRELAAPYSTPDGRPLTSLRALDIVVWEHSWGCNQGPVLGLVPSPDVDEEDQ